MNAASKSGLHLLLSTHTSIQDVTRYVSERSPLYLKHTTVRCQEVGHRSLIRRFQLVICHHLVIVSHVVVEFETQLFIKGRDTVCSADCSPSDMARLLDLAEHLLGGVVLVMWTEACLSFLRCVSNALRALKWLHRVLVVCLLLLHYL